jgi:hypothetical protein
MNRPFVYLVELRDSANSTLARYQSRWVGKTVTWENSSWQHVPGMEASGISSGQAAGSQAAISLPLTAVYYDIARRVFNPPGIAVIRKYDLNPNLSDDGPQPYMVEIGNCIGQVIQMTNTTSQISLVLGSVLSPTGASFVPRTITTQLAGSLITI